MIEIPFLGEVEEDQFNNWLMSKPIAVNVLGGEQFELILDEYKDDKAKEDFHEAIQNFLSIDDSTLKEAQDHIYRYYRDIFVQLIPGDDWYVEIATPDKIWKHIKFGSTATVSRRPHGDKSVYISLECSCDWEREHGLQIVFKQGLHVNKIGPFDGHLTNSDAYANDELENVVYR
ncbi:DUF6985 domain-containing protein [Microbulbifer sp. SSSA002]|uniref:DUF6985 domain-containing protein n=1 Tax=Microbulbifer sp. SSSA002 TaxID=3243376 RepID=UPI004039BA53